VRARNPRPAHLRCRAVAWRHPLDLDRWAGRISVTKRSAAQCVPATRRPPIRQVRALRHDLPRVDVLVSDVIVLLDLHEVDGVRYNSRFAGDPCVALFVPARSAMPIHPVVSLPLTHPDLGARLAGAALRLPSYLTRSPTVSGPTRSPTAFARLDQQLTTIRPRLYVLLSSILMCQPGLECLPDGRNEVTRHGGQLAPQLDHPWSPLVGKSKCPLRPPTSR
jgi:hypothetical protein